MENHPNSAYRPPYALIGLSIAIAFWVFDSTIHHFLYGEPEFEFIPSEFNELWMRTTIFLLIIAMGIYAERSVKQLMEVEAEQLQLQIKYNESLQNEIRLQKQKLKITKETVEEVHDVLNNFLNSMLLFQLEAKKEKPISEEHIKLFDIIITETAQKVRDLGERAMDRASISTDKDQHLTET